MAAPAQKPSSTATPATPDWLDGSSSRYPASRYLSGVGQGDDAERARQRARADLARTFEVRIVEEIRDATRVSQQQQGGEANEQVDREMSRTIATFTDQMLEGVAISEMYQQRGEFFALATLERSRAVALLSEQITALDERSSAALATANRSSDRLVAIGHLQRALNDQERRSRLNRMLAVAAADGATRPPIHDLNQLQQRQGEMLAALTFTVAVAGDDTHGRTATLIATALQQAGFSQHRHGDYQLRGKIERDSIVQDGWHWQRGQLQLELRQGDRTLGSHRFSFRASATSPSVAEQRALDQLANQLNQELQRVIIGFAAASQ
jgi:hypothetical protein